VVREGFVVFLSDERCEVMLSERSGYRSYEGLKLVRSHGRKQVHVS
jgi:hypothetical protein